MPPGQTLWGCRPVFPFFSPPYPVTFTCSICVAGTPARSGILRRFSYFNDRLQIAHGRLFPSRTAFCPHPLPPSPSLVTRPPSHLCPSLATIMLKGKVAFSLSSPLSLQHTMSPSIEDQWLRRWFRNLHSIRRWYLIPVNNTLWRQLVGHQHQKYQYATTQGWISCMWFRCLQFHTISSDSRRNVSNLNIVEPPKFLYQYT